jgi:hypothetical protein
LEEKYLLGDMFKEFNQISINNPLNTFFSLDRKKQSRIDYIWCTEEFFDKVLNTYIYDVKNLFNTDHKLLVFSMEGYNFLKRTLTNNTNDTITKKVIYNYDKMDDKRKARFKEILNRKLEQNGVNLLTDNIDKFWTILRISLQEIADEVIGKKEIKLEKRTYNPKKESKIYRIYRELLLLIKKLKTKSKEKIKHLLKHWHRYIQKLEIWKENKSDIKYWNYPLTQNLRDKLIEQIIELKEKYLIEYIVEIKDYKEKRIEEAVEQLCLDLKDNQK